MDPHPPTSGLWEPGLWPCTGRVPPMGVLPPVLCGDGASSLVELPLLCGAPLRMSQAMTQEPQSSAQRLAWEPQGCSADPVWALVPLHTAFTPYPEAGAAPAAPGSLQGLRNGPAPAAEHGAGNQVSVLMITRWQQPQAGWGLASLAQMLGSDSGRRRRGFSAGPG